MGTLRVQTDGFFKAKEQCLCVIWNLLCQQQQQTVEEDTRGKAAKAL